MQADRAVLACRITKDDSWCRRCGEQGSPRDSVTRELAHEPLGWRPTTLLVTIRPLTEIITLGRTLKKRAELFRDCRPRQVGSIDICQFTPGKGG